MRPPDRDQLMSGKITLTPGAAKRLEAAFERVLRERHGGRWKASIADDNLNAAGGRPAALRDDHLIEADLQDAA